MAQGIFIPIISILVVLMLISIIASLIAKLIRIPLPIVLVFSGVLLSQLPMLPDQLRIFLDPKVAQEAIIYVLLPIIIFEEAYRFDISKFAANWKIISILAFPGVLFSTCVISTSLTLIAGLSLSVSLILGIILSATDPSATIAIFKESGAPKNLVTIVEGESLLNDASVIALYKIALLIIATNLTLTEIVFTTLWHILWLFGMGAICGWLMGHLLLWLMRRLPDEPYIEISITFIATIVCYIGVENYIHASGIIALTTCGLLLAKNMPLPITHASSLYLDSFWSYLSEVSKAVIFIVVGLWFNIEIIGTHWPITLLVVASMLLARSILVYFILPYIGHLSRHEYQLPRSYQHICLWGGLRGAVTLALAMLAITNAPMFSDQEKEMLLAVAMGAVAFTILIQGASLDTLARHLSLNESSLDDEITQKELMLSAMKSSKQVVAQLIQTPFSDSGAPQEVMLSLQQKIDEEKKQLDQLYRAQIGSEGLYKRLIMKGISIEIGYLYLLYDQGIIPADIYQYQKELLDQHMDAARHKYQQPTHTYAGHHWIKDKLLGLIHGRRRDISFQYDLAWSRLLTSEFTMQELQQEFEEQGIDKRLEEQVLTIWRSWHQHSEALIQQFDIKYPLMTARAQREWLSHMLKTIHTSHLDGFVTKRLINTSEREHLTQELVSIVSKHTYSKTQK